MDEIEFFAPWRLVAAFADGSRLLFDGLTEEQARDAMEAAQEEHGDIGYWNRVTDQNYEDGRYYKTVPPPPCINIVDYDGYTGPLDENGLPVVWLNRLPRPTQRKVVIPTRRRSSSSATLRRMTSRHTKSKSRNSKSPPGR